MSIYAINSYSFKGLPPRRYPYILPQNAIEGEEEAQMPKVREEIARREHDLSKEVALYKLQSALIAAEPYLDRAKRGQVAVQNAVTKELKKPQVATEDIEELMSCSAQSVYQQDKHDAIWLFNIISQKKDFNSRLAIYRMASAFKNLDRTFDSTEISKAEETLRKIFKEQPKVVQADIQELYGNGKNLNFNV